MQEIVSTDTTISFVDNIPKNFDIPMNFDMLTKEISINTNVDNIQIKLNPLEYIFWCKTIKQLKMCENFEDFFVEVSKMMKFDLSVFDIKKLRSILDLFLYKYKPASICYLQDYIDFESVFRERNTRKDIEIKMKQNIVTNFNSIFPEYQFIATEYQIPKIGRIDIFAIYQNIPVIIELKSGNKSPNSQLIAYSSVFENPILIGITEKEMNVKNQLDGIKYIAYSEVVKKLETI